MKSLVMRTLSGAFFLLFLVFDPLAATLPEALNATNLTWTTGGSTAWYGQGVNTRDGQSARSGAISHGQASSLQTEVEGPGALTFWWIPSSEPTNDLLSFSVNGAVQNSTSGASGVQWVQVTNFLGAGTNVLVWSYTKNASISSGLDAGFVDQVQFVPGGTGPVFRIHPSNTVVGIGRSAVLKVAATGTPPLLFQWRRHGTNISGATNATLEIESIQTAHTGSYSVAVSNDFGDTLSQSGMLVATPVVAWGAGVTNGFTPHHGQSRPPAMATNVLMVAAGGNYSLALRSDGRVIAWGASGSQTNVPASATNVAVIAAGDRHNLALRTNGTVVAWGDGSNSKTSVPAGLSNVVSVAAGWEHSLALLSDGRVISWGAGSSMSGFHPHYSQGLVPAAASPAVAIAAGAYHSMALLPNGTVRAWGLNTSGQTNVPAGLSNVVAIAAGGNVSAALKSDGTLAVWGGGPGQPAVPGDITNAVAIAAGENHLLALRSNGAVMAWGQNIYGETNVPAFATNLVAVSAGRNHNLGLIDSQTIAVLVPPRDQSVAQGAVAVFSAAIAGTWPRSYQWQKNQIDIPNATNRWLTLTNVQPSDEGAYRLVVSNTAAVAASSEAVLNMVTLAEALNATNLIFTPGNVIPWTIQTTQSAFDGLAVAFGPFTNSAWTAILSSSVMGPGTLSFWWNSANYSSEVAFELNGAPIASKLSTPWVPRTFYLPAGTQSLKWVVRRTTGGLPGQAYLDQITFVPGGTPPTIASGPASQTVAAGNSVSFTAGASGTPNLAHQWFFNGTNLAGGTGGMLTINNAQAEHSGLYSVRVTNEYGAAISSNALLTVTSSAPVIVSHPADAQSIAGGSASFSGSAKGSLPIALQWQFNGTNLLGATNSQLTLNNLQLNQGGLYRLVASNAFGTTASSNAFLLTYTMDDVASAAGSAPIIWIETTNTAWFPQTNVTHDGTLALQSGRIGNRQRSVLRGQVAGPATVTFWWKVFCDSFWSELDFAVNGTNQAVIAGNIDWRQQTVFVGPGTQTLEWIMLRDAVGGSITDAGWMDQISVVLGGTAATITTNPANLATAAGNTATFSVQAIGTPPLNYQWRFEGNDLPGATNAILTIGNVQTNHAGLYSVAVRNDHGPETISTAATLTVSSAGPVIVTQPKSIAAVFGSRVTLSVAAKGSSPLNYQWLFNSQPIAGAESPQLIFESVNASHSGDYQVVITNMYGAVTSVVARLQTGITMVHEFWSSEGGLKYGPPLDATNLVAVASGASHTMGLRADGTVSVWGFPDEAALFVPADLTNVAAIAAGWGHCLALREDGTVVAWGEEYAGATEVPPDLTNVVAVASAQLSNLALKGDGTLVGWGNNEYGQLSFPASLSNVVSIALGAYNGYALKENGELVLWGNGPEWTQNGQPTRLTVPPGLNNISQIVTMSRTSATIEAYDYLRSWGWLLAFNQPWFSSVSLAAAGIPANSSGDFMAVLDRSRRVYVLAPYSLSTPYVPESLRPTNAIAISAALRRLTVLANDGRPFETRRLLNRSAPVGSTVIYSCGIVGAEPMNFQWQLNGTNLLGHTNMFLALTNATWSHAGTYRCLVSNPLGELLSSPAELKVVRAIPHFILSSNPVSPAGFALKIGGLSGTGALIISASSNLLDWNPVFTNPPMQGTFDFVDPDATGQEQRFYRAMEE
jgi:alpha-tubulin suppressor-like RCC1 family protein